MHTRRLPFRPFLCLGLVLPACSMAPFEAQSARDLTEPAAGLSGLACTTHNGEITLIGAPGRSAIAIHAVLSARGYSDAEAKANVELLAVQVQREGSVLTIQGEAPADFGWAFSPCFSFTIEAPPELAATLTSHNGDLTVRGAAGELAATTHNGAIAAGISAGVVHLLSHNGQIDVAWSGSGPVQGDIATHNGEITVGLGARAAVVEATTHNGEVAAEREFAATVSRPGALHVVAGEGGGSLVVGSHNGSVTIK